MIYRRLILYGLLILFFCGALFVMSQIPSSSEVAQQALSQLPQEPASTKQVQVMKVIPQPVEETIRIPGKVEAWEDVALGASRPGIIDQVMVREGDRVQKDQVLFTIDTRELQSLLTEAKSSLELAKKTRERYEKLRERGDITLQKYDETVAQETQAQAAVKRIEVQISLGSIKAPIEGIVDQVDADVGEFVQEGQTLARLLQLEQVKVKVGVPEKFADQAATGKTALVEIEALQETREANIERVAYAANQDTNTFETTLVMENPDLRIRPGMIARVVMLVRQESEALMIPLFALVRSQLGMKVFVVNDNVTEERLVEIGAIQQATVEITKGLQAGDQVVIIGQKDLIDGQPVIAAEVVDPSEITPPAGVELIP